jgi:hypothetical protein
MGDNYGFYTYMAYYFFYAFEFVAKVYFDAAMIHEEDWYYTIVPDDDYICQR